MWVRIFRVFKEGGETFFSHGDINDKARISLITYYYSAKESIP